MTLTQVFGSLLVFALCPILGALPVVRWVGKSSTPGDVENQRWLTRLEIAIEAFKGAIAVLLARQFFPAEPEWEIVATIALVMGNYWARRGVSGIAVIGAIFVHDWLVASLVSIVGSISLTLLRERQQGRLGMLILFPVMVLLLHGDRGARVGAAISLSGLLFWLYRQQPSQAEQLDSSTLFGFFRPDKALVSLEKPLKADRVGQHAATLSRLQRWGYPIPDGWVLLPGDDPQPLLDSLNPSMGNPFTVSASPLGRDGKRASAAGQYFGIAGITSQDALEAAISQCLASYDSPNAIEYRQELDIEEDSMAVVVQKQVRDVFSGVAFSRDPIKRHGDAAIVETLPGELRRVTSGEVTPERYRVFIPQEAMEASLNSSGQAVLGMSEPPPLEIEVEMEGKTGDVPPALLRQVAWLVRHLEARCQQVPQSIEWSYDGQRLWVLQCRPVSSLLPVWRHDIVDGWFRGTLHPLSWSIHRPLLIEAWEEVGSIFLGDRAGTCNFNDIVSLHNSRIYFNTLSIQEIEKNLDFNWGSIAHVNPRNIFKITTLFKYFSIELRWLVYRVNLYDNFSRDRRELFQYFLNRKQKENQNLVHKNIRSIIENQEDIDKILSGFKRLYWYNVFTTLSIQKWQKRLRIKDRELDRTQMPAVMVESEMLQLAIATRHLLPELDLATPLDGRSDSPALFARLSENEEGRHILEAFDGLLDRYGYWNESGIDLAETTWKENPHEARELFTRLVWDFPAKTKSNKPQRWRVEQVQKVVKIQTRERQIYRQLFAQLRSSFIEIEQHWLAQGVLSSPGDIFFLTIYEVRGLMAGENLALRRLVPQLVAGRRSQFQRDRQPNTFPNIVYGNPTPAAMWIDERSGGLTSTLQGIAASPGRVDGRVQVLRSWQSISRIDRETILVIPSLDPSWTQLFARAGGLIALAGGQLSHGAIVAREYRIPAVINIDRSASQFRDGQRVQLDGTRGIVTILDG